MKIMFFIIIGLLLTCNYSFSQNDSVQTIILHLIDPYYKDHIRKIVLPNKSIKIKTTANEILQAKQINIVGDTALAFSTDTIPFKNIQFVSVKTKGYVGQSVAGTFMIVIGSLVVIPYGLFQFFIPSETIQGSDPTAQHKKYVTSGILLETLGVGLISSGIVLISKTRFKTQNEWDISTGYYKK